MSKLVLSNSQLEMYMHSERCFWWRYIRKLFQKQEDVRKKRGSIIHKALALWYVRGGDVDDVLDQMRENGTLEVLEDRVAEGDFFSPERLRTLLNAYTLEFATDLEAYDILGTEQDACVELMKDVDWRGIFDLVVRDKSDGKIYIIDHKSTEKKVQSSYFADRFTSSQQMTGYHWMGQHIYGDEFGGMLINGLQSTITIPCTLARFSVTRDDWQVEEFTANAKVFAPRIIRAKAAGKVFLEAGLNETHSHVMKVFPMRWGFSENWCDYKHLNTEPPALREAIIEGWYTNGD